MTNGDFARMCNELNKTNITRFIDSEHCLPVLINTFFKSYIVSLAGQVNLRSVNGVLNFPP